jgi:CubicO group peptidase (beta-lactamase class C family)
MKGKAAGLLGVVVCLAVRAGAADRTAANLPRSTPEAEGVSSAGLLSFVEAADERLDTLHSFMLVRHGRVVAEGWWSPYAADTRHSLYSLTKSFTSTAIGLAVTEGKLHVDDPVLPFFPDDAPASPSDNLKAMRIRDLLTMSTGHHAEASLGPTAVWTKAFLEQPVEHKPGTFFLYNTPASNTLAAILEKATGTSLGEYLRPRLFEPLGIDGSAWDKSPQGTTIGGFGLNLRTEEIAKFGQLYLRKGEWNGRRVIPAAWVETATARQASNGSKPESDWEQGYGYQFWRCRHGFYRGDGAFGQFCVVMPEKDTVVAITSGIKDMQSVLNLVWDKVLPALGDAPLPKDAAGEKKLRDRLAGLSLKPVAGQPRSPLAARLAGRLFAFPANDQKLEAVGLEPAADGEGATLVLRSNGAVQRLAVGRGEWKKGRVSYGGYPEQPAAASGAWSADDTYVARIAFYQTPFALTVTLRFADEQLLYDSEYNVAFGPTKQPQLVGRPE